jgi:hypothetical protein
LSIPEEDFKRDSPESQVTNLGHYFINSFLRPYFSITKARFIKLELIMIDINQKKPSLPTIKENEEFLEDKRSRFRNSKGSNL